MGGTTMVMALVLPEQHCSLLEAYEQCRELADAKACCDYALHVGVTWWGPKVRGGRRDPIRRGLLGGRLGRIQSEGSCEGRWVCGSSRNMVKVCRRFSRDSVPRSDSLS